MRDSMGAESWCWFTATVDAKGNRSGVIGPYRNALIRTEPSRVGVSHTLVSENHWSIPVSRMMVRRHRAVASLRFSGG